MLTERYERSVVKELLLDPAARHERTNLVGPLNFLLVGSDQRSATPGADQRADTIMIAHVPDGLERAYLISIPRDLLVEIPPEPGRGYLGGTDKINAAFQYGGGGQGGTRLLSATLSRLTGIRFNGAALIDFSGFRRVIDLLGGVELCVEAPVRSIHTGTVYQPGCQQMSGGQALDYARQRYDLPGGDFDRQRHQQQLLRAMLEKVRTSEVTRNPIKLDHLLRAVGASLTVDTNGLPLEDLVLGLRQLPLDTMLGIQVPSHAEETDELSYVRLDAAAAELFRSLQGPDLAGWAGANPKWVRQL
ncbi:LCP family protein [Solwaraspora sp. WMMD1047]|uniref:LCP family protein n=1 Tax=Solwaraspora sp. WMMD1047 TaxID=3016102 RepID=UPI0024170F96|nr:LCP family protein [Solwaraspora sp. WMMD1047]MDG4827733.1 LCP family protein [Solwaraspora sp. WMMD1047]